MNRKPNQLNVPIQPVERPILCSLYGEPTAHWVYDTQTGEAHKQPGRRPAGYWYSAQRTGSLQQNLAFFRKGGIQFCVDLSATPFYLQGSGYIEGGQFPWLVSLT
ncbi:hypothetical protein HYR99_19295 [Candidatus Poribacteria bacterium]|nr:hypothetical protein [Candidatus Poribacteria bacterium]